MVQGNYAHGEYWIDCDYISESVLRPLFGAWVTVCVAVIAMSIRSVYRSKIRRRLYSNDNHKKFVSLWDISPATNPAEVFDLRAILARAVYQRNTLFFIASIACVGAAIVSSASTTIANNTIVRNRVIRHRVVDGRLVTHEHASLSGAVVNVTSRAEALATAQAPLNQLFDFAPDDSSEWVFVAEQWNNTWTGNCTFSMHPAVDLVVYPTNSSNFQDEVPLLGSYLPQWATIDPTRQGTAYSGFYTGAGVVNDSGAWRDLLVSYAFGSAPFSNLSNDTSTVNISFANFLAHNVGRYSTSSDGFVQTSLKSDVYVVECILNNSAPGIEDQAYADSGQYTNSIGNVANLYTRMVGDASINQQPVIQPTGQQMFRNWQAFMSVRDGQYPHLDERTLSVAAPVVQMRISVLLITVGGFIAALTAATVSILTEPRDSFGRRITLPSSPLDWIVQAAREHEQGMGDAVTPPCFPSEFAMQREDLMFGMSTDADGQSKARIMSSQASPNEAMSQLAYLNATPLDMKPEVEAARLSGGSMIA